VAQLIAAVPAARREVSTAGRSPYRLSRLAAALEGDGQAVLDPRMGKVIREKTAQER